MTSTDTRPAHQRHGHYYKHWEKPHLCKATHPLSATEVWCIEFSTAVGFGSPLWYRGVYHFQSFLKALRELQRLSKGGEQCS